MSDSNTIYQGVIERQDPDVIIAVLPPVLPFGPKRYINLPGPVRDLINKNNALSKSTVEAVKVAYVALGDRKKWVQERIDAVDERVKYIKTRTDALLSNLQDKNDPVYSVLATGVQLAVSAVPVVGTLVSSIIGKDQAAQKQAAQIDQLKTQMLIRDYTDDLKELAKIRGQLANEFAGPPVVPKTGDGKDNPLNAPKVIPVWYYYVGAFVVLVVLLAIYNRQKRR